MKDYVNDLNIYETNKDFELSHIIGLNTNLHKCIQAHPTMADTIIYSVGGILVVEDLNDRNNQVYFRHGKNQIGSFKISNNGRLIAAGFISDNPEKKIACSVILWNFETKEVIYELTGINKGVSILEFSQDDLYLSAAGLDNTIFVWQVDTGYKCFNKLFEFNINLLQWTYIYLEKLNEQINSQINNQADVNKNNNIQPSNQNKTEYFLTIANVNIIYYAKFYYDINSMQYYTNFNKFNLPSTGYNRIYTSSICDLPNRTLYMGTSGGELSSFNLDNLFFKSSFNVINAGVTALIFNDITNSIIIGGGDGRIKKLILNEGKHILTHEIQLTTKIMAITQGTDPREFYAATKNGEIYRVLAEDFTYTLHSLSHVVPVNGLDFFRNRNDNCFIIDDLVN